MWEVKKNKLEHSIEYNYPRETVKNLFKDAEEEYKRFRNPTDSQTEEYREMLITYTQYTNRREYDK